MKNYRGFRDHELPLKNLTVIVGKNNAGKTTLVEALRLLSIVVSKYKNAIYRGPPGWTDLPIKEYGVAPSLRDIEISFQGILYGYGEPPGNIEAIFSDGSSVSIYLNDNKEIFAVIKDCNGNIVTNRHKAQNTNISSVSIMPQVTPVQINERMLTPDYVRNAISSRLSSLHFRNQLHILYNKFFSSFQEVVENTWDGVGVDGLEGRDQLPSSESRLNLFIRNEGFVGEIGLMGHGLQMWLQTMWFLTYSHDSHTVILDEPDVYMHPDLQRRFIRFLRDRFPQVILTTHSIEIMSEVEPEDILVIDKDHEISNFATSLPAVQRIISTIGSVHNVHIARLFTARRFVIVEGKDIKFLKHFQDIIFLNSETPFQAIPRMSIEGWGGWKLIIGSSMKLKNVMGKDIYVYCILDRDYYTYEEINERYEEADQSGINLHIWSQKEIENFILSPTVIHRYISNKLARCTQAITLDEVITKIEEIAQDMKVETSDRLANEFFVKNKSRGYNLTWANKKAREHIQKCCEDNGSILPLVSGKSLLSKLSFWSKNEVGVQITPVALIREFRKSEIHPEMISVIDAIENMSEFYRFL